MCAVFCGESAPLEQYNYNYTFPVLSFLPSAHIYQTLLQSVCCVLWGVGPVGEVQLLLNLSSLSFPSAGASTTIITPFWSCLSFCQHTRQVEPEWSIGHPCKLNAYCHKYKLAIGQIPPSLIREDVDEALCIKFKLLE